MASSTPFDPSGTRYDQKTYAGRLAHFREMVSPSTLFVSDAELAAKSELLERHARGAAPEASDADADLEDIDEGEASVGIVAMGSSSWIVSSGAP